MEELSEFELPARQLDAEINDEFHSQSSEIHHQRRDHRSSISSEPPIIPQNLSGSSIAANSGSSGNDPFQSFVQSPGSAWSRGSSPEELFENHFQVEDELLDEMLHDSPAEDDGVTGAAANQIPEPETERTPESGRPEDENNNEPEEGDIEPVEINTPAREQEEQGTRREREMSKEINTPSPRTAQATRPADNVEESGLLDGSTTTDATRRKSSRRSIPQTDTALSTSCQKPPDPREEQDHQ